MRVLLQFPFRFHAPWWAWLLMAGLVLLFLRLGVWQMDRAEEKKAMISAYQQAAKSPPRDLAEWLATEAASPGYAQPVQIRGQFLAGRDLLLDNQVQDQKVGYHVWSAVRLAGGQLALVNRGWVPMNPDRSVLPVLDTPVSEVTMHGVWQPLPRPGLRLAADDCDRSQWPRVVQYPLFDELRCLLGPQLLEGLLWLDPAEPHGFVREWGQSDFPPERHYGYALQWFSLAATLVVLFVVINIRRKQ